MQQELQTKYITLDDFKIFTGIDLTSELEDDNVSNAGLAFLKRIEVRMESFIHSNYFISVQQMHDKFSDFQKEHYKYALLEQALYIYKNHDISVDSGYDGYKINVTRNEIKELSLSPNAKEHLELCGVLNRQLNAFRNQGWMW